MGVPPLGPPPNGHHLNNGHCGGPMAPPAMQPGSPMRGPAAAMPQSPALATPLPPMSAAQQPLPSMVS
jgi:hypothetical protein